MARMISGVFTAIYGAAVFGKIYLVSRYGLTIVILFCIYMYLLMLSINVPLWNQLFHKGASFQVMSRSVNYSGGA